jgi:hypothetical protein
MALGKARARNPDDPAALSEPAMAGIVPRQSAVPIVRSLTMIREDLFARHGELFLVLLQACEHGKIALIQYRTAVSLDVAGASRCNCFRSTVLQTRLHRKGKATGRRQ